MSRITNLYYGPMLTFYYGPMGTKKTSRLIQSAKDYEIKNEKTTIIKSARDTKGGSHIINRAGGTLNTDILLRVQGSFFEDKNYKIWKDSKHIFVDEVELLTEKQIYELLNIAYDVSIPVSCYGLDYTFKGFLWNSSKILLENAEKKVEMHGVCMHEDCRCESTHTYRKIDGNYVGDGPLVLIDGKYDNVEYGAFCAEHFHNIIRPLQNIPGYNKAKTKIKR